MMCKMNMIFHNISNARIELGDTLINPKLVDGGVLNQYDLVVANPPFSQNYTTANMQFKERFQNWMSKKKQADFMFVQHMISVLKNSGRMAVVMPHGVLFRGGEEQKMRKRLIIGSETNPSCILECVIGLPQGLFYGTGIPASLLIINKADAKERKGVFFINADREYKEGKNQNSLRPEDIEKISYVYHNKIEIDGYSRMVTKEILSEEDYNCNIRRYVDNSEPPTPQDVKAHLRGGVPHDEIENLRNFFDCYKNLKNELFSEPVDGYANFTSDVKEKGDIKNIIANSNGKDEVRKTYKNVVDSFWKNSTEDIDNLFEGSLFDFNNSLTERFVTDLTRLKVLDKYQVRGSFAHFFDAMRSDFYSVQSSGWTAELIPDDELISNEFPEVLKDLARFQNRRDELDAKFAEIADMDQEEWDAEQYEIIPKTIITEVKAEIKELKAWKRDINKEKKALEKRLKSGASVLEELQICTAKIAEVELRLTDKENNISRHIALENELKDCRKKIREIEINKETLADKAREQISDEDAKRLITARWLNNLHETIDTYLEAHIRQLQQAVELLYDKYSVTLTSLIEERDAATEELEKYLKELGYISK